VVAFAFGFIHGFGFGGALTSAGLARNELPLALVSFNVGVEIGQLGFILLVLALERSFRVLEVRWPRWVQALPGYTVGSLGAFGQCSASRCSSEVRDEQGAAAESPFTVIPIPPWRERNLLLLFFTAKADPSLRFGMTSSGLFHWHLTLVLLPRQSLRLHDGRAQLHFIRVWPAEVNVFGHSQPLGAGSPWHTGAA
jgi:HupE / UreJ protein